MPDRVVRENILKSSMVDNLSWSAEVFYRRLMSVVDDYGRFEARPNVLRASLYALRLEKVSEPDVAKWLDECSTAGLIRKYPANGKEYIEILQFDQKLRVMREKYPPPKVEKISGNVLLSETKQNPNLNSKPIPNPKKAAPEIFLVEGFEYPFQSDEFLNEWVKWLRYKKTEHRFTYKSEESQLEALADLCKLGNSDEITCIEIIKQSRVKGWKGLFELKNGNSNGQGSIGKIDKRQQRLDDLKKLE